jgi:hypothetical protein
VADADRALWQCHTHCAFDSPHLRGSDFVLLRKHGCVSRNGHAGEPGALARDLGPWCKLDELRVSVSKEGETVSQLLDLLAAAQTADGQSLLDRTLVVMTTDVGLDREVAPTVAEWIRFPGDSTR